MRSHVNYYGVILACGLLLSAAASSAEVAPSPSVEGVEVLARVNGEPITLDYFLRSIGTLHASVDEGAVPVRRPDPSVLLQRVVGFRLVLQEAANIGFDELPEVVRQLDAARFDLLKDGITRERLEGIVRGDPEEVERLYREVIREPQVESALFESEELAESFRDSVASGTDFQFLVTKMAQQGLVKGSEDPAYVSASQLQPAVAAALEGLEVGAVTSPIFLGQGFAVIRLLDVRFPDNPEARGAAEEEALVTRKKAELAAYTQELRERYTEIDEELLRGLDLDSADPAALAEDSRVVAKIKGGDPVTVAELTARLEEKFFHGLERAQQEEQVQAEAFGVLDRMALERATLLEAARLGIEERDSFQQELKARREGLLFNVFVEKAVNPGVEVEEADLRAFYSEHGAEYSSPEMWRLESLAFDEREAAEAAMERLREGADLQWLRANAPGRADIDGGGIWDFRGMPLPVSALPDQVQAAVTGASSGDVRLCAQPDGPFHVVRVNQVFPPEPLPFDDVRGKVAGRVFADKQRAALEGWMAQLREASDVEMLVDKDRLRALVGLEPESDA